MSRATFYWRKRYGDLPERVLKPPRRLAIETI
jgi:hypothetical protein